ncbi:MAG: response regulator [Planctomycetota bacterium]
MSAAALRVLVVDDEDGPRAFLEELLRGRGHVVVSAGSLEEAVAALAQGPFDLVVMDLNLPVSLGRLPLAENGYALETRVRAVCPRGRTYLIVLTGKGLGAMDSSLAHDHGCDAYVLKGDRERLLAKLAEGEAQARARPPAPRAKGALPLKARTWQECSLVLGRPGCAKVGNGAEVVVEPSETVDKVLFHLYTSEEGSDLSGLASTDVTRRSLAREARKFLRKVFEVKSGSSDPVPRQRARGTWICLVKLTEPGLEQVRESYEERRSRDHDVFEYDE